MPKDREQAPCGCYQTDNGQMFKYDAHAEQRRDHKKKQRRKRRPSGSGNRTRRALGY